MMIVESRIDAYGTTVTIRWSRSARGYAAELVFEGGDRAILDAPSLEELEQLVRLSAGAAAMARSEQGGDGRDAMFGPPARRISSVS